MKTFVEQSAPRDRRQPRQEPDRVSGTAIAWISVGLISLVLLFSGSAWWMIESRIQRTAPPDHVASRGGPPPAQVNQIEMTLFAKPPPSLRSAALRRLQSYGWTDRDAQLIHIPIDRAMTLYLAGVRAEPAPAAKDDAYARAQAEESR